MALASNLLENKNVQDFVNVTASVVKDTVTLFKLKPDVMEIHSMAELLEERFANVKALTGSASEGAFNSEHYKLAKLKKKLNSKKVKSCEIVQKLVSIAIETLDYLGQVAKKEVEATDDDVADKIQNLLDEANDLREIMVSTQATPPAETQGNTIPNAAAGGRASDQVTANAKFKAHIAQRTLELNKENREKMAEQARQDQKALMDILIEMQKYDINKIDYDKAIELLNRGLEGLGNLKTHWSKLARCFSDLFSFINAQFGDKTGPLTDFQKYKELVYHRANNNLEAKFQIKKLNQSAKRLEGGSKCITVATAVYLKISDLFVMPNLSSLDTMIALQPEKRKEARNALLPDCEKSSKKILAICEEEFGSSTGINDNAPNKYLTD